MSGMSCAACQNRVEKAVSAVPGVTSCSVSLLTNSMGVEGTAKEADIIQAVENAGYGAKKKGAKAEERRNIIAEQEEALKDHETPILKKRLIWSVGFLLVLMYLSMGHHMWNFPVPAFLENHVALALTEMLLAIVIMYINKKFFTSGFKSLWHRSPNMDTLVAMGSAASFGYSLVELYLMIDAMGKGEMERMHSYANNLYFESAAMIVTLITIGKMLEALSKGRTTNALKSLMKLAPKTAMVERNGEMVEVGIEEVEQGDIFAVKPGENIPVDGIIVEGNTTINEAALTGESIPVDKGVGDEISAATLNQVGYIKAKASRVGEDTTLAQIIQMVSDAAATKAEIARIADTISGYFVPAVLILAALTLVIWLVAGKSFPFAIARAISVLVISCPCALGLATPVAIMVGNGVGAKNGILFKTAVSLEEAGKAEIVCLDKTGTITSGEMSVTDVVALQGEKNGLMAVAAGLEAKSEHPLAKAIVQYAKEENIEYEEAEDFEALVGNGISAKMNDAQYYAGSESFISTKITLTKEVKEISEKLSNEGKTPLFFLKENELLGIIGVADTIKKESKEAIRQLKNLGIKTVMLTGDNERTANAIGKEAEVDQVIAGVLPSGKEQVVRKLAKEGKIIMVGDGINDAPALTRADLGMAIGAGSDVAIDAADIVLMKSNLLDVPAAIRLSRATIRNIHENLFWAFFYNLICIPLAMGLYQAIFHLNWEMSPMLGAAAMSLSSVTVCSNALRLNLVDIYNPAKDKKRKRNKKESIEEETEMKKTLVIEGMMCPHCEATVKKALENVEGVAEALVSHEAGTAVVTLNSEVANETLKAAVEAKDYTVKDIQ